MRFHARNGYSTTAVLVLCAIAFFTGIMVQQYPGLPSAGRGLTVEREGGSARSLQQEESVPAVSTTGPTRNWTSFEELLEWSGMLADRPVLQSGETGLDHYVVQPFQLLSIYPRAYIFPKFLSEAEADKMVELAASRLAPSGLALKRGDDPNQQKDVRTSSGTFLSSGMDKTGTLRSVEEKIAAVTGVPSAYGEPFNVLRYENGQHYHSHLDAFPEKDYGPQSSQRIATMLLYLTDVEEGGETTFLLEGKDGLDRLRNIDYTKCDTGIQVKPRKGDALLFWNINPDGSLDQHALHGGCDVVSGQKWAATKWMRNKCIGMDCPKSRTNAQ
uniref:Fe2OG dioxygenase domain-containing protein n=1 Tax=Auxenochlorella protothecoides TaxID=3075 RepID=A0A1D1ZU81_AUXPR